jgi:hypothetical protein
MDNILIHKYITEKRFSKYGTLAQYEENLLLSKQHYIPLSILEVSLRNAINYHFEKFYGAGWLVNESSFLQKDHLTKIFDAKQKIKSRKEILTKDKLIAELSFGFWANLFKSSYDRQMRISNLKQIFTNLSSKDVKLINRNELFQTINHIRNFRNRIFHHEKIVNKVDFQNIETEIDEILGYLHKDILAFSKRINNVH